MTINQHALVGFGSALKYLGNGKVAGHGVLFTDQTKHDLYKDYFDKESDLDIEDGDRRTAYFNHGLDKTLKNTKLGKAEFNFDGEVGLWMQAQIDERQEYSKAVLKLADDGELGLSTGALSHLVIREAKGNGVHYVKNWPVGEISLTTTPAEPRTQVMHIKSFAASLKGQWLGATIETDLAYSTLASLTNRLQDALWRSLYAGPFGIADGDDAMMGGAVDTEEEGSLSDILSDFKGAFDEYSETAIRIITALLKDVTPASQKSVRAFLISTAAASKSVSVVATVRDLEALLRDAGLSRKVSAAVALHGFKGLQRDADKSEVKTETHTPDIPKIEKRFADLDALKARLNAA